MRALASLFLSLIGGSPLLANGDQVRALAGYRRNILGKR